MKIISLADFKLVEVDANLTGCVMSPALVAQLSADLSRKFDEQLTTLFGVPVESSPCIPTDKIALVGRKPNQHPSDRGRHVLGIIDLAVT